MAVSAVESQEPQHRIVTYLPVCPSSPQAWCLGTEAVRPVSCNIQMVSFLGERKGKGIVNICIEFRHSLVLYWITLYF